jgi:hypothetical protein
VPPKNVPRRSFNVEIRKSWRSRPPRRRLCRQAILLVQGQRHAAGRPLTRYWDGREGRTSVRDQEKEAGGAELEEEVIQL